jgi:AMMECR1 domain-containing protein
MAHEELKLLTTYAMFGIKTINDANLERDAQRKLSFSSKSRFGVFVTLRRNENVFTLDHLDETQIHGCMGHWTPKYNAMMPEELVYQVRQLAHDVRFKDDRRLTFDTDVDQDASAVIEINFMNLPLNEIDDANGNRFDNKTHGLIVDSGTGKRATYLPGVFPTAKWNYISQSLRQKAGLGPTTAARFYAYETTVVTFQAYNTLFSDVSSSYLRSDVAFFYLKHYQMFVPYEYDAVLHVATVDQREAVRNVACIGDVAVLAREYKAAFEPKPILSNLEHYYQKWLKNPVAHRQVSIFLIRAYHTMGVHFSRIHMMSAMLYSAIGANDLEPKFELGEAVSVLAKTSVSRVNVLMGVLDVMRKRAFNMLNSEPTPLDNVFEMNWQSQSVRSVFQTVVETFAQKNKSKSKSSNSKSVRDEVGDFVQAIDVFMSHVMILFHAFMKTAQRTILRIASLETNFLAVIYEFLANLEMVMILFERHFKKLDKQLDVSTIAVMHDEIRNERLHYFSELLKRRGEYGLYYFKDGKRARLDLTGHVLSLHI